VVVGNLLRAAATVLELLVVWNFLTTDVALLKENN